MVVLEAPDRTKPRAKNAPENSGTEKQAQEYPCPRLVLLRTDGSTATAAPAWQEIRACSVGEQQEPGFDLALVVQVKPEARKAMPKCPCAPRDSSALETAWSLGFSCWFALEKHSVSMSSWGSRGSGGPKGHREFRSIGARKLEKGWKNQPMA